LFNREVIKALQEALEFERKRYGELLQILQNQEKVNTAALQFRSAAFPTVMEEGWVETFDDLGQKVFIKPN